MLIPRGLLAADDPDPTASISPKSNTAMVWGWDRRDTIRASARKRSAASGSCAKSPRRILRASAFPIRMCSAL